MAVIRRIEASRGLDIGSAPQVRIDDSIGAGLRGLGEALSQRASVDAAIETRRQQMAMENETFAAEQRFQRFKQDIAAKEAELQVGIDPSGNGYAEGVAKEYETKSTEFLNEVPVSIRSRMSELLVTHRNGVINAAAAKEADQRQGWFRDGVTKRADELSAGVMENPDAYDASLAEGSRLIEASGLPPVEKAKLIEAMKTSLLLAKAENYKRTNPARLVAPKVGSASDKGAWLRDRLVKDLGLSRAAAAAFAGNLHVESGGYKTLQEIAPMVPGSRGGYGWAQWTGPRRRQFEAWAAERGLATDSDDANYGFLVHELTQTGEGRVLDALRGVSDPAQAALIVSRQFLRPGIPHEGKRVAAARMYADGSAPDESGVDLSEEFAELPAGVRLKLYDEAVSAQSEMATREAALAKAEYASMRDSLELGIATGEITSQQDILQSSLNDGDKATLIGRIGEKGREAADISALIGRIGQGEASVNPYDPDARKIADGAFGKIMEAVPVEQALSAEKAFVAATGYVPKNVVSELRLGAGSQDAAQFATAMQRADVLDRAAPQALAAIDGASEVRTALEQYRSRINMGLDADGAAKAVIDARSPERAVSRDVLKPEAAKFMKTLHVGDVVGWTGPDVPVVPEVSAAMMSEYQVLAEEAFYETGGDAGAAKGIALAKIKQTWGATSVSGSSALMKYPPEKFYPAQGGGHGYIRDDVMKSTTETIADLHPERTVENVSLVPEASITRSDIEAGRPPRYRVFYSYKTPDGVTLFDEIPGVLWSMDRAAMFSGAKAAFSDAHSAQQAGALGRWAGEAAAKITTQQANGALQDTLQTIIGNAERSAVPDIPANPADVTPAQTVPGRIASKLPGIDPGLVEQLNAPGN